MCWKNRDKLTDKPISIPFENVNWGGYKLCNIDPFSSIDAQIRDYVDKRLITQLCSQTKHFMASILVDKRYQAQSKLIPESYPAFLADKYDIKFFTSQAFDALEAINANEEKYYLHLTGRLSFELFHHLLELRSDDHLKFVLYGLDQIGKGWEESLLFKNHVLRQIWFLKLASHEVDTIRKDCNIVIFVDEYVLYYLLDKNQEQIAAEIIEDFQLQSTQS